MADAIKPKPVVEVPAAKPAPKPAPVVTPKPEPPKAVIPAAVELMSPNGRVKAQIKLTNEGALLCTLHSFDGEKWTAFSQSYLAIGSAPAVKWS